MPLATEQKQEIIASFQRSANDTGSAEVQVALITQRVKELTEHLKAHKHDHSSTRGLKKLVGQRRRLLKYLSKTNKELYTSVITRLELKATH
jgi:small subunit ribosomal protein S15